MVTRSKIITGPSKNELKAALFDKEVIGFVLQNGEHSVALVNKVAAVGDEGMWAIRGSLVENTSMTPTGSFTALYCTDTRKGAIEYK